MGERQAGLSGGQPRCWRGSRRPASRPTTLFDARSNDELRADRARGRPAHAEHRRSRGARADGGARASSPGQFYRLQNFETLAPQRRRHAARDGRPRAHRRLGRSRAGPALDHRARDGRLVRPVRAARARRAGRADGADRHADRDAAERDRAAGRRRARQRGAVLDRPGAARERQPRALFRRLQDVRSTATRSRRSKRAADVVVWCCDEAPGFTPDRPQDKAFVGNIVQAMRRLRRGRAGRAADPAQRRRPHHRDRLRRHDGGGRRARATASWRRISSREHYGDRLASTRRCSA